MLVWLGGAAVLIGLLLILGGRLHLAAGAAAGDIVYRGRHSAFIFPSLRASY